jgi:hypothetical protein
MTEWVCLEGWSYLTNGVGLNNTNQPGFGACAEPPHLTFTTGRWRGEPSYPFRLRRQSPDARDAKSNTRKIKAMIVDDEAGAAQSARIARADAEIERSGMR